HQSGFVMGSITMQVNPSFKYGCGSSQNILILSAKYSISRDVFIPVTIQDQHSVAGHSREIRCMVTPRDGKESDNSDSRKTFITL
ncbi:unnamed protein product, partial [Rangifer tarandus platyrhynchus]